MGIPLLLSPSWEVREAQAGKVVPPFPETGGEKGAVNTRSREGLGTGEETCTMTNMPIWGLNGLRARLKDRSSGQHAVECR